METLQLIKNGITTGLCVSIPVGPIALFCIQQTLSRGYRAGIAAVLGASTADACFGAITGFGLTALSSLLLCNAFALQVIGGSFLCYLGIKTYFSRAQPALHVVKKSYWSLYSTTFLLTISNPLTIIAFLAIITNLSLSPGKISILDSCLFTLSVFIGSAAWFISFITVVNHACTKLSESTVTRLQHFSGLGLLGFGGFFLIKAFLFSA